MKRRKKEDSTEVTPKRKRKCLEAIAFVEQSLTIKRENDSGSPRISGKHAGKQQQFMLQMQQRQMQILSLMKDCTGSLADENSN